MPVAVNVWTGGSLPGGLERYNRHAGWAALAMVVLTIWLVWLEANRRYADPTGVSVPLAAGVVAQELAQAEERRARRVLLAQAHDQWVAGVLERSPARVAPIALGLADRPGAVIDPWALSIVHSDGRLRPLPAGTTIQEVYARHHGQLLLLGAPGAGKTTLLLELARDLIKEAADRLESDSEHATPEPMPVVFHLATWAIDQQPIKDWIASELQNRYGVPEALARTWVAHQQVAPLLDGLDEVAGPDRATCVAAINAFAADHGQLPIVVCCRTEEFDALDTRVRLAGAVMIQPLDRNQVQAWLRTGGRSLAGLRAVLRDDEQLWELLDTPLMLSVVTLAYRDRPAAEIRGTGGIPERRRQLFDDYVSKMQARTRTLPAGPPAYSQSQMNLWLGWLARALRANEQSVFFLDWVQADWLPTRIQRLLAGHGVDVALWLGTLLIPALVSGLLATSVGRLTGELRVGLGIGLIILVFILLMVVVGRAESPGPRPVQPVRPIHWSWPVARGKLVSGVRTGISSGSMFGAAIGGIIGPVIDPARPAVGLLMGLAFGFFGGIIVGLTVQLVYGLLGGFIAPTDVQPTQPGLGIQVAGRNARITVLVSTVAGALLGGLIGAFFGGLGFGLGLGLGLGLGVGLIAGSQVGGETWIRHHILRWLLFHNGYLPRDAIAFLDYASDRVLLYRTGGGYLFIHRLLRDYFAEFSPAPPSRPSNVLLRHEHTQD
jgi:DNA polymerase III delta prime subunit